MKVAICGEDGQVMSHGDRTDQEIREDMGTDILSPHPQNPVHPVEKQVPLNCMSVPLFQGYFFIKE